MAILKGRGHVDRGGHHIQEHYTEAGRREREKRFIYYDYHCIYPVGILGSYVASSFINDVGTDIDS